MSEGNRSPIPAELRRQILVEAGHRCAIPTCRYVDVDVHHIIPWEECRKHDYDNLIALCPNCHRRAEKGEIDRKSLRMYKSNLRFAMEKYSHFEMDVLFELYQARPNAALPFPTYLGLLIKRILDAGFVEIRVDPSMSVHFGTIKMSPDFLVLTQKGRAFIESLGLKDVGY